MDGLGVFHALFGVSCMFLSVKWRSTMLVIWKRKSFCLRYMLSLNSIQKWAGWITLNATMSYLGIPFVMLMGCQKQAKCSFIS